MAVLRYRHDDWIVNGLLIFVFSFHDDYRWLNIGNTVIAWVDPTCSCQLLAGFLALRCSHKEKWLLTLAAGTFFFLAPPGKKHSLKSIFNDKIHFLGGTQQSCSTHQVQFTEVQWLCLVGVYDSEWVWPRANIAQVYELYQAVLLKRVETLLSKTTRIYLFFLNSPQRKTRHENVSNGKEKSAAGSCLYLFTLRHRR